MLHPEQVTPSRAMSPPAELLICLTCALGLAWLFLGWSRSPAVMALDAGFFEIAGQWTQRSWAADMVIVSMFRTDTAKMVPLLAAVVWLLADRIRAGRGIAFFGHLLLGSFVAMTASRLMQNLSSHRPRPLQNPDLAYPLPHGIDPGTLAGWSSFPSDTAALGFAIAAGILLAARGLGIAAILWVVVVVAFPRAYAGLHYPSDLLGGALIGMGATLGLAPLIGRALSARMRAPAVAQALSGRWMPWLAAGAFLYLFQMATMFDDVRSYGAFLASLLGG